MRALSALILVTVAAAGCGDEAPARGVVLVTLDTTRADHIGCYGDARAKTPALDALAAEGARFDQAESAVTTTLASHATMFTGLYPPAHGVRYNGMFRLVGKSPTVAEQLREHGFSTAGFPAAFPVTATTGISRGFDLYRDIFTGPDGKDLPMNAERKAEEVVHSATEFLSRVGDKKFFVWVHLFDAHWPYEPPFPFSAEFSERPYDGEIAYADREMGKLFDALKAKKMWDGVAVIVAGDHGEGLFDHGERQHGHLAYESTLRVPLVVKPPKGGRAVVVREPVTLADLAPTILDYAGVTVPAGLNGVSLREAVRSGKSERRDLYFESLTGSLNYGWSPIEGLRRGSWKLIGSSAPELYDLASDPGEAQNAIGREPQLVEDLTDRLRASLAAWSAAAPADAAVTLDRESLERLRNLGYAGGTMGGSAKDGPSPASKIHLEAEILQLRDLADSKAWPEALASAKRILADDPGNRFCLYKGAVAATQIPDLGAARELATTCATKYPEFKDGVLLAAQVEIKAGRLEAAIDLLRKGVAAHPKDPELTYPLAAGLISDGRASEAAPLIEEALAASDPPPAFYVLRALSRSKAGDPAGAMQALRDAFAHGYRDLATLRTEPALASLRKVAGFEQALSQMERE
ncbi:MAG TPA: sulfatase-like hydrolase/transferase [Candidatus Polarisedimenticolaceae bacterium]|nr:sulfatase-like hydrolase/transferase [Candidatus Polarisedimenticolaceae bacterium]